MWQLIFDNSFDSSSSLATVLVNANLTTDRVIVQCSSTDAKQNWFRAGYLQQRFDITGFPPVSSRSEIIGLETQLVPLYTGIVPYRLSFDPVYYLHQLSLKVWVPA